MDFPSVAARAGFVLTGGKSVRMGRDKAFLPIRGSSLVEQIARQVQTAAGNVALVGAPERYGTLGFHVIPDLIEDAGPMGGLYTALRATDSERVLIVACDMPGLTVPFLTSLFAASETSGADGLVPETASGLHPLCAVYHRRVLPHVQAAIQCKSFKMHDLLKTFHTVTQPADASIVENVNSPAEWEAHLETR